MSFKKLLDSKKIEKIEKGEIDLSFSEKDISTARKNFDSGDYEWALAIAYNSVLRAGREFMSFLGYRPIGKTHHKNVFEFLRVSNFEEKEFVDYFDIIRKKRNKFVYGVFEGTSRGNAKEVIENAEDFVHKIRTAVHKIRTAVHKIRTERNKKDKK